MHEHPICEADVLRALRRSQLSFFTESVFAELEPGRPYLHNWHLDHIAWQLTPRRPRRDSPAHHQRAAALDEVDQRLGRLHRLRAGPRSDKAHHLRLLCRRALPASSPADTLTVMRSRWYQRLFPGFALTRSARRDRPQHRPSTAIRFASGLGGSLLGPRRRPHRHRRPDQGRATSPPSPSDAASPRSSTTRSTPASTTSAPAPSSSSCSACTRTTSSAMYCAGRLGGRARSRRSRPRGETYRLGDTPGDVYRRRAGELLRPGPRAARGPRGDPPDAGVAHLLGPVPAGAGAARGQHRPARLAETLPDGARVLRPRGRSWDTASTIGETSDWSVGTVWGAKGLDFYLLDVVRGRFEVPDLAAASSRSPGAGASIRR